MQPAPWQRQAQRGAYVDHLRTQRVASNVLARALLDAAQDAQDQLQRILTSGAGDVITRAQLQNSVEWLQRQAADLWGTVEGATLDGIRAAAQQAAEGNLFLAEYLVRVSADDVLVRQFQLAARHNVESVRAKIVNDVRLSPRVYRNQQRGIDRAQRVVTQGIAQGRSAAEIAGRVKHLVNPNTPGGVSYAAKRLARTEINNAFHGVNTKWYAESPFVEGVQWNLSNSHPSGLDDECVDFSEGNHDNLGRGVFRPENVPTKPHPNCLCFTVAVTVTPEKFTEKLLGGQYDGWLADQGFADIQFGAA